MFQIIQIHHQKHRRLHPPRICKQLVRRTEKGPPRQEAGKQINIPFLFNLLFLHDRLCHIDDDSQRPSLPFVRRNPYITALAPFQEVYFLLFSQRFGAQLPDSFHEKRPVRKYSAKLFLRYHQNLSQLFRRQYTPHVLIILVNSNRNIDTLEHERQLAGRLQKASHHPVNVGAQLFKFRRMVDLQPVIKIAGRDLLCSFYRPVNIT